MADHEAITRLESVLDLQRKAFIQNPWISIAERKANIKKIPEMVLSNKDEIREALNQDFSSHPAAVSDFVEVLGVVARATYVISKIDEWTASEFRDVDPQMFGKSKGEIRYQPKGVVGNIVPWNFPIDLSLGPLCEMLAAGNRVIIKPSEYTPATANLLARMIKAAYPEDLVTVVIGGLDLAKRFPQLRFDHILYTGNPAVGKIVMGEAAKNLVPVTLELGGKCPVIMTPGSVTPENVKDILGIKMIKSGQMCISVDHVYCPRSEMENFISEAETYFKDNLADFAVSPDNTGMISERHLGRIKRMITQAEDAQVRSITLGGQASVSANTRQLPLTLVVNPPKDLDIMTDEIFGPILPIIPYDDLPTVVNDINVGERPLGLYVYSDDLATANDVVNKTNSGGAAINCAAIQGALPALAFGGSGNSGMGRHHGVEGFREFSNPRGVFTRGRPVEDLINVFTPPYAKGLQFVVEGGYQHALKSLQRA
ncbi:hypothetical protein PV10_00013 [Exophiala mesophila]|uniref:Aldehyde dehydrogenase n=1 Tax=Exophiala mesophila TaxID=212818 RepID=A0A0D1ZQ81_EXOME|nr:uncharacterized protein PV10_00013 [Exophiala mesophila]KIV96109.1 hypothetical protein PV10_00013 [Exophiala mesophila]